LKANCWNGITDVRIERVPDPSILNPRDAIIRVTSSAICDSDLHLYDGCIPTMMAGDILGHEFMGEVVEVGRGVDRLKVGERVVVPFAIACGQCFFCQSTQFSLCENSNPNASLAEALWGHSPAGLFGYSHMLGGYAGGQAEYVRVPYADIGPIKVPDGLTDAQVLFLSDILPTGYTAAENCDIEAGDTIAVWGCGPVGLFAIVSARLLGAEQVIAIDRFPERLRRAHDACDAITLNYAETDVQQRLRELTGGRGPDACIDAVGMEAHGHGAFWAHDRARRSRRLATDRPTALREAIIACRSGGVVSIPGVYGGFLDKLPFGAVVNKALTIRTGQTHVHRYLRPLLELIEQGRIDPSFVISHVLPLEDAPEAYRMLRDKADECVKVVLKPGIGGRRSGGRPRGTDEGRLH
jgi:threonine dehydrogenase-like Zn-dependent dehydrogenase